MSLTVLPGSAPKIGYRIALSGIYTGNVQHAGVHTDVADDRRGSSVHQHTPCSAAQVAVQSVGIADGYGSRPCRPVNYAPATVADRFPRL